MQFEKLHTEIQTLAELAGREINRIYQSGQWTVEEKSDSSPVTQADLAANQILVPGIRSLSNDPIVSEESDPQSVQIGSRFWLIDPLDGTRDFIAKRDTFVICIALVEDNYPIFGLIHSPVTGESWWAAKDMGSYGPKGNRLLPQESNQRREALIAAGSRSMPSERMQMFYDRFQISEVRRYGSALKFCRLAECDVDLYPRFGPTSEWDTAAGQIIAEEAGCKVLEISTGQRLRYGKPRFENRGGFMAARSDLDIVGSLHAAGLIKS